MTQTITQVCKGSLAQRYHRTSKFDWHHHYDTHKLVLWCHYWCHLLTPCYKLNWMGVIRLFILITMPLHLIGMWEGEDQRTNATKTHVWKMFKPCLQISSTNVHSLENIIKRTCASTSIRILGSIVLCHWRICKKKRNSSNNAVEDSYVGSAINWVINKHVLSISITNQGRVHF